MSESKIEFPEWAVFDQDIEASGGQIEPIEPQADKSYTFYNDTITVYFDAPNHIYYRYLEDGTRHDISGVTTVLGVINKPFLVPWATKLTVEHLRKMMVDADGRIKPFSTEELNVWLHEAKNKHKERLNEAGDIGTLAHNTLEDAIISAIVNDHGVVKSCPTVTFTPTRWNPEPPPEENMRKAQNCVNRAFEWMVAHNVRWIRTEQKIYSRLYDYSGTLDGDALIDSCTDKFCKGCRGRFFRDSRAITDWKSSNHLSDSYAYQTAAYQFALLEEHVDLVIPDRWIMRLGKEEGDFEPWYLPAETFEADFNAFIASLDLHRSLDEIRERRSKESKEFNAFVRDVRKAEKAAAAEAEKERKKVEREELKAAKQQWDADKKIFYKNLRSNKVSTEDAERLTEEAFPKANRPGAKEEATADELAVEIGTQMIENLKTNVAEDKQRRAAEKKPDPFVAQGEWVWRP